MRVRSASVALVLLAGCGMSEGPLLIALDGGGIVSDGGSAMAGAGGSAPALIAQDDPWQYQLTGAVDTELDVRLFVVDLFNVEEDEIASLKAQGTLVVGYLSAGTRETYRDDAGRFPAAAVGQPLESYPNESWLDIRDPTVRALMAARLDLARTKRFDGVFPTNLTAYRRESGFELTAADQADYTTWLAREARARGLRVGMGDDFARAGEFGAHFDFAIHYGCIARGDCALLEPFRMQGKSVLDIETSGTAADVCRRAAEYQVNAILKNQGFGAHFEGCP
jgi:hypothetical protein